MSTPLTSPVAKNLTPAPRPTTWPNWLREPLLHFVLLGGVLFATDHVLVTREDDPHTIVVGAEVDREARDLFTASSGREPKADELKALRERWVDNEVLYREGLAMKVDRGDTAIRERVIFKALSVVDSNVKLPRYDDKTLRDWFDSHRAKYDEPPRFDFQEAVLSGENNESTVRAFVDTLNNGTPGDAKAGLRVFKGRPRSNLEQSYGPEFAKALEAAPASEWRPLPSRDGWHAMRLESITPPKPAVFEAFQGVVLQDWTDAVLADQRTAAVRAMGQKYKLLIEGEAK